MVISETVLKLYSANQFILTEIALLAYKIVQSVPLDSGIIQRPFLLFPIRLAFWPLEDDYLLGFQ